MSFRFVIVFLSTQLYQNLWFHAIFMPVIIEFSRCIGANSSAKFELVTFTPTRIQVFEYQSGLLVTFTPTGIQVFKYQSGLLVAFTPTGMQVFKYQSGF